MCSYFHYYMCYNLVLYFMGFVFCYQLKDVWPWGPILSNDGTIMGSKLKKDLNQAWGS